MRGRKTQPVYITIAGPQSSGKSTALAFLKKKFPRYRFYQEINPFTVSGGAHRGGAFVTTKEEERISAMILARLRRIARGKGVHVEETGPFHLTYTRHTGLKTLFTQALNEILLILRKARSGILFIDTSPRVSWERRRAYYRKRVADLNPRERRAAMNKYRKRIYAIYRDWLAVLQLLPFRSVIIKNGRVSEQKFLADISRGFRKLVQCLTTEKMRGEN